MCGLETIFRSHVVGHAIMSKEPKVGDTITCRHTVEAYGSNYGSNTGRYIYFHPGDIGTVASIAPKVFQTRKGNTDPRFDHKDDFLVVDFVDDAGVQQRTALHYCNACGVNA